MAHDVVTLSDHALITFIIDEAMLAYQINSLEIPNGDAESMAASPMNMLGRLRDASIPRKKKAQRKPPV